MADYQKPVKATENKDERPDKIEKVVVGEVITRKRPLGMRMKEVFFGADMRTVTQYLASDVLLPALRNLLFDSITKGGERLIYGEGPTNVRHSRVSMRPGGSAGTYMNYTAYQKARNTPIPVQRRGSAYRRQYEDIVLSTRREAEEILERMHDILDKYETVTVSDMKELTGQPRSHVDRNWGWVYLRDAEIRQIREGYLLILPLPEEL